MPTDLSTAEKAAALGLIRGEFSGDWYSRTHVVYTAREIDALYAERFPVPPYTDEPASLGEDCLSPIDDPTAPDYRAALEGLVKAHDHLAIIERTSERVYPESYADARARLAAALTHARKVLHGQ